MSAANIMYPSLSGQVIAITGAASGIGLSLARLLASQGSLLSLADINSEALTAAAEELLALYPKQQQEAATAATATAATDQPRPVFTYALDVRSAEACEAWATATQAHFAGRRVRGAALMAGVVGKSVLREAGLTKNLSDEEFGYVLDVNVRGALHCLRALLPVVVEGEAGRGGGSVVLAGSAVGSIGSPMNGAYTASKHAIHGIMRTAAKEEGHRAIRVNAVAPGIIQTPLLDMVEANAGRKEFLGGSDPGALRRRGDPGEVAQVLAFLLSDQASFVNGAVIPVDGGWLC